MSFEANASHRFNAQVSHNPKNLEQFININVPAREILKMQSKCLNEDLDPTKVPTGYLCMTFKV